MKRDEMTPMKREGTLIMFISFLSVLIGLFDIFFNQNYSSLTLILISCAGFTGGFLWMEGKTPESVPLSYLVSGTFIALGFVWQGFFTKNWFWILVGAAFFAVSCMVAGKYKVKTTVEHEGANHEK